MKVYLCLGDCELLESIASGKITEDTNLNDSERRSARHLYNQELITAIPLQVSGEAVKITPKGKVRLAQDNGENDG
ncbi:hypothetical protein LCGC14_2204100 [marine sediment metagenome]|uniref:Uncharacterized protein n=1 Tax=marine sediment metagenome TaxID=412755 RepID=A0A0F9DFR0_9ZZZZ